MNHPHTARFLVADPGEKSTPLWAYNPSKPGAISETAEAHVTALNSNANPVEVGDVDVLYGTDVENGKSLVKGQTMILENVDLKEFGFDGAVKTDGVKVLWFTSNGQR